MDVGGSGVDLFGLYVLAVLVNVAALALGSRGCDAHWDRSGGPGMQLPVFLVLFLAPVYVPLSLLEGWIRAVARLNPISYFLEAARGFLAGDPVTVGIAFGAAAALGVLFALWAVRGLRRAEASG